MNFFIEIHPQTPQTPNIEEIQEKVINDQQQSNIFAENIITKIRGDELFNQTKEKRSQISLWTFQENNRYLTFLENRSSLFSKTPSQKRKLNVYKLFSNAIVTRTPEQCKSHHQKMMKHHESIQGIILHIQKLWLNESSKDFDRLVASMMLPPTKGTKDQVEQFSMIEVEDDRGRNQQRMSLLEELL